MTPAERQAIEYQLSEVLKAVDTIRAHLDRFDDSDPKPTKRITDAEFEKTARRSMQKHGMRRKGQRRK